MMQQRVVYGGTKVTHKKLVTWFLVADGSSAQIYVRRRVKSRIPMGGNTKRRHIQEKYKQELKPLSGFHWQAESAEDYDVGNKTLGRVFESANPMRHMSAPHMDIREDLKLRFMRTIASQLQEAQQQKSFDRLVLIAPPKLLGELKKQLSQNVLDLVIAELPKELARHKVRDLWNKVDDII